MRLATTIFIDHQVRNYWWILWLHDSKLILKISNEAQKIGFCPELFIQVNTGNENQKAGVIIDEVDYILELAKVKHSLPIVGLMCLPPMHDSPLNHFKILLWSFNLIGWVKAVF